MPRMQVRCCCDAGKLLGTVDVPDGLNPGDKVDFRLTSGEDLRLELGTVYHHHGFFLTDELGTAVKSMDTPIEKLREIPSFKEAL